MLQSVYLVNERGETIAAIPIGDFQIDEALFGGFLSAIQMYSKQISGKDIKELTLENFRLIISKPDRVFLVTIHDIKDKNADTLNKELSKLVEGTLGEIITEETIQLIKETATNVSSRIDRATDWASKML
ncbi:MAG: hypothetical protein ACTSQZ_09615 [Candidatus Thorarchaeota archaeon]